MTAETVYPILQSLDREEQARIVLWLQKDLEVNRVECKIISKEKIEQEERIEWLKKHVFKYHSQ